MIFHDVYMAFLVCKVTFMYFAWAIMAANYNGEQEGQQIDHTQIYHHGTCYDFPRARVHNKYMIP